MGALFRVYDTAQGYIEKPGIPAAHAGNKRQAGWNAPTPHNAAAQAAASSIFSMKMP